MPAAKLSLGYPFSSIKRLFDVMGPGMAKHFMFTAEKISADEALSCGLVQKLVKEEDLELFVNNYASTISKNAPLTIKAMKQIGIEISKNSDDRDLLLCEQLASACFDSEDYKKIIEDTVRNMLPKSLRSAISKQLYIPLHFPLD